jgi:hypothetical protein
VVREGGVLTVVCWKWGNLFGPEYVNTLRSMLARHLHAPHRLVCVTDDCHDVDLSVECFDIDLVVPKWLWSAPRCVRRMAQFDPTFQKVVGGSRFLTVDLDVVLVDDVTPLFTRSEPLVAWRVGYAQVYCGSVVLQGAGVLADLWAKFSRDPERFSSWVAGTQHLRRPYVVSDQNMLNAYVSHYRVPVAEWTEHAGFVTYFGRGYERLAHLGVGPSHPRLPQGARIVVLGSADKAVLDERSYPWVEEHWR